MLACILGAMRDLSSVNDHDLKETSKLNSDGKCIFLRLNEMN